MQSSVRGVCSWNILRAIFSSLSHVSHSLSPTTFLSPTPLPFHVFVILLFLNIKQLDALNFIISLFQASTCFEHMCLSSRGKKLYYTVSSIITPIGGRPVHGTATNFCPLDDKHMCSKHVEAWNKLITKFSASSWLILRNRSTSCLAWQKFSFLLTLKVYWRLLNLLHRNLPCETKIQPIPLFPGMYN